MSVRYPVAPCGCKVEVYDRFDPVCRMDCPMGDALVTELVEHLRSLPAGIGADKEIVARYEEHALTAIEAVTRPMATTPKEA